MLKILFIYLSMGNLKNIENYQINKINKIYKIIYQYNDNINHNFKIFKINLNKTKIKLIYK